VVCEAWTDSVTLEHYPSQRDDVICQQALRLAPSTKERGKYEGGERNGDIYREPSTLETLLVYE